MLLAGDIGGTKTVLALFDENGEMTQPLHEATFPSEKYPSLEAIIARFLVDHPVTLTAASFGVAGPVMKNRAQITNLPWVIDAQTISQQFQIPSVHLLNDLAAIATAVPHLTDNDLVTLNQGHPAAGGTIAVIAPGTGLGEAFLVWTGSQYIPVPSEGGHAAFGPTTPLQVELLTYLQNIYGHVSYERVCSGSGIPNLYNFLKDGGYYSEPEWLKQELAQAEDPTPIIVTHGRNKSCELCAATVDLFVEILGGEAGNLAMKVLATGGVYIGGGIPPRILPELQDADFMAAFVYKGRFSAMMEQIPIHVIRNAKTALFGAAYDSLQNFRTERG